MLGSPSKLVALAWHFTKSEQLGVTSLVPMGRLTVLSRCSECLTTLLAMWTKVVENARYVLSLSLSLSLFFFFLLLCSIPPQGAIAVYLEPWHADILEWLQLRKNHGQEELRARDLFYGLWTPDLFMARVEANEDWTLFCPHEAPGSLIIFFLFPSVT